MRGAGARLLGLALLLGACRPQTDSASAKQNEAAQLLARASRFRERLALATAAAPNEPLARWIVPRSLKEISGLALASDGRLFAHDDDDGQVFVFEPRTGEILKEFRVGDPTIHGDFEGIALAGRSIYLITSNGVIVQFEEGANGDHVPYAVHDTHLGHECEFEGIAFDSTSESLVLPCKHVYQKELHGQLVMYRWSLASVEGEDDRLTRFTIPFARVIGSNPWTSVHPSDITVDPSTGNYVLVASREKGVVEITPAGQFVRSFPLPGKHPQAEGVALTRDSVLMVSDEASNHTPATITLYHWPPLANSAGIR